MSGLSGITGYPGEVPIDTGVFYGDPTGGLFGAAAVTTALWHRRMTGEGQHIDLSQREAFASILPELTFDYVMNGRVKQSTGNKHPEFAPQGCYRCKGEDAWVAITVHTDEQFSALRDVFEIPALLDAGKYGDMPSRKRNEASLDAIITGWTLRHEPYEAMHLLQSRGVPAGAVLTNKQLLEDPHFKARGYFEQVNGPFVGPHRQIGMPWKLPETPATVRLASPGLGEHNEYALGDLLGLSAADLERLAELNVIGTEPLSARQ
jgi:benzylsuccinate CoA-transferase BbsF subunit